jgi:hypothetical protein
VFCNGSRCLGREHYFVAPPVKKQILEGKDVNLTILLSSKYDLPQQHTMQSGGLTVELNTKKDVRLEHNLSLEEFNQALLPQRLQALLCTLCDQI